MDEKATLPGQFEAVGETTKQTMRPGRPPKRGRKVAIGLALLAAFGVLVLLFVFGASLPMRLFTRDVPDWQKRFVPLNESAYREILATPPIDAPPKAAIAGPFAIEFSSTKVPGYILLDISGLPLKNLMLGPGRVTMTVEKAITADGVNVYDPKEPEGLSSVGIGQRSSPPGLLGIRTIQLPKGVFSEQVREVSGKLKLSLPIDLEVFRVPLASDGAEVKGPGERSVVVRSIEKDSVTLESASSMDGLLMAAVYNLNGTRITGGIRNQTNASGTTRIVIRFFGDAKSLNLYFARSFYTQEHQFFVRR